MILSHDPSKTWGESLLCSLALAKRRHKQGYDAVKLTAACGIPGPEKGLPGGVANTADKKSKSDTISRTFGLSGVRLIHVVLIYKKLKSLKGGNFYK